MVEKLFYCPLKPLDVQKSCRMLYFIWLIINNTSTGTFYETLFRPSSPVKSFPLKTQALSCASLIFKIWSCRHFSTRWQAQTSSIGRCTLHSGAEAGRSNSHLSQSVKNTSFFSTTNSFKTSYCFSLNAMSPKSSISVPYFHASTRGRDRSRSAILLKRWNCAERPEVRESRTRALDPRHWPKESQLWERECHSFRCKQIDMSTTDRLMPILRDNARTPLSTLRSNPATLTYNSTFPQGSFDARSQHMCDIVKTIQETKGVIETWL